MHACDRRTDGRTDGQNYDSQDRPRICSRSKNGGLDPYGAEPFEQQQHGTAGVEGVNLLYCTRINYRLESCVERG